ncbi:MAG: hypothetical protein NZT61_01865 [Deltaproteobacteria bacterium]|nr:hypothetical protein [Deltaproteobacteria bacterium]
MSNDVLSAMRELFSLERNSVIISRHSENAFQLATLFLIYTGNERGIDF